MIVADTGAIVALIDRDDRHHETLKAAFLARPHDWILPWAILLEVDYLLVSHLGAKAESAFLRDLADGAFSVEWGDDADVRRASDLRARYSRLNLGLVDGVVMAIAERLRAKAIATLDVRHFGVVELRTKPRLIPRDLES